MGSFSWFEIWLIAVLAEQVVSRKNLFSKKSNYEVLSYAKDFIINYK